MRAPQSVGGESSRRKIWGLECPGLRGVQGCEGSICQCSFWTLSWNPPTFSPFPFGGRHERQRLFQTFTLRPLAALAWITTRFRKRRSSVKAKRGPEKRDRTDNATNCRNLCKATFTDRARNDSGFYSVAINCCVARPAAMSVTLPELQSC